MLKTSAGRRFEHFYYFGVKLYLPYRVYPDVLKTSAGRRFEHFSYFGVKLYLPYRVYPDVLKTSAGRRFQLKISVTGTFLQFFWIQPKLPFSSRNLKVACFVLIRHIKTCLFRQLRKLNPGRRFGVNTISLSKLWGLTLVFRSVCLHTCCTNTGRQALCESTCRQAFLTTATSAAAGDIFRMPAGRRVGDLVI